MNWGLFLALVGWLLPLSLAIRLVHNGIVARQPVGRPVQLNRLVQLSLLAVILCGKTPVTLHTAVGGFDDLAELTETFMVTPWGLAQVMLTLVAVLLTDAFMPRIIVQLSREPFSDSLPGRSYLLRDVGVIAVCLALAWIAAR